MDLESIVGKTIDSLMGSSSSSLTNSKLVKLMDNAVSINEITAINTSINNTSIDVDNDNNSNNNINTPKVKKRKAKSSGIDQLLQDAQWYTSGYGKESQETRRSAANRIKREKARKEKEEMDKKKQEEWDALPEEEHMKVELERLKLKNERRERREERLKIKRESTQRRREAMLQKPRKSKRIKAEGDYYYGSEIDKLVKASQFFLNQGGKMLEKRQSKPPVRFEPPELVDRRYKLNQKKMKSLTHRSSTKLDKNLTDSDSSDTDSDNSTGSDSDNDSFSSDCGIITCKSSEEPEVHWFTTVLEDGEIDLTDEWKIMDDFVYLDDIPSTGNIPAIQASSLCADSSVDHHFFKGQKVYIHYPLSEYKEEYALFLPKSDTQFNPFDELGKIMELIALTFFPDRESQMVVNYDNPSDCIIGRYIKAFELYDEAQAIIEKNVKNLTKKPRKIFKRKIIIDNNDDFDFSKNDNKFFVHDNDKSDLSFGSHWRRKRPTKKLKKIETKVKIEEEVEEEQFNNLSLLPTPSDGSLSPFSSDGKLATPESVDYSMAAPLPFGLWNDPNLESEDLLDSDKRKPLASHEMELVEGIRRCIDEFNILVDQLRDEGSTFNVIRSRTTIPRTVVYELLNQCYSRTVLPECRKLKGYKAFSSRTYGELMPSFLTKIYNQVGLSKNMKFIDLGSGVGNCTIQAALEFGADSYGVEIMKNASELANQQYVEFCKRCAIWGIKPGNITLLGNQSFTENVRVKEIVDQCNVLLINNYLFDHELNEKIVELLQDIKVGTKIISLKPIVPVGYMTTWTSSTSILDRMKTTKHVYGENSVSWTFSGGYYFITEVMAEVTDDNFAVLRKRGYKPPTGSLQKINLNVYTNNV